MSTKGNEDGQHKGEATLAESPLAGYLAGSWPLAGFGMGTGRVPAPLGAQRRVQRVHTIRQAHRAWKEGHLVELGYWLRLRARSLRWPSLCWASAWLTAGLLPWALGAPGWVRLLLVVVLVAGAQTSWYQSLVEQAAAKWLARKMLAVS